MQTQQSKSTRNIRNQERKSSQKNNSPITEFKGTEFWDLADKKFKVAILKKLIELQENSEEQINKTRKDTWTK